MAYSLSAAGPPFPQVPFQPHGEVRSCFHLAPDTILLRFIPVLLQLPKASEIHQNRRGPETKSLDSECSGSLWRAAVKGSHSGSFIAPSEPAVPGSVPDARELRSNGRDQQ